MSHDPNISHLLADRYRLISAIGQGAMSSVYQGEDTLLGGVTVAVKFLAQTLLNSKMRHRFEREAKICALLSEKSLHIVRVKDYGVDNRNVPYYVMEFLQGKSLNKVIAQSPLSLPHFLKVVRQVCLGMEAAHKGIIFNGERCSIIHRDIKPSNILLLQDSSLGELVKVLDFGIARLNQASAAQTQSFMGTLAYCSPEQMEGKELDQRSDIYSLGITMYEMLTGKMPILPENNNNSFGGWYRAHRNTTPYPFDVSPPVPNALAGVIMRCLAKDPRKRPQNVKEIRAALESIAKYYEQKNAEEPKPPLFSPRSDEKVDHETMIIPSSDRQQRSKPSELVVTPQDPPPRLNSPFREGTPFASNIIYARQHWPQDKPKKKIVFPRIIREESRPWLSLWAMLDRTEIEKRRWDTRYSQFLFIGSPHPMIAWVSVLFNKHDGARWLPCYLDLKTDMGQRMTRLLSKQGNYQILMFSLDQSEQCAHHQKVGISSAQREQLTRWASIAMSSSSGRSAKSRDILRQEYEKNKEKILMKLATVQKAASSIKDV